MECFYEGVLTELCLYIYEIVEYQFLNCNTIETIAMMKLENNAVPPKWNGYMAITIIGWDRVVVVVLTAVDV